VHCGVAACCLSDALPACADSRVPPAVQAKNLVPDTGGRATKVGEKVVELQRLLPNARVVYCSATGVLLPQRFNGMLS
jgi:P-loop containing NTP hydrolase pore-1